MQVIRDRLHIWIQVARHPIGIDFITEELTEEVPDFVCGYSGAKLWCLIGLNVLRMSTGVTLINYVL